jgi:hypothetical protein
MLVRIISNSIIHFGICSHYQNLDSPSYPFSYCPSIGAAALFSALFGIATIIHAYQAFHFRKRYLWVLIMGGIWETLAFTTRTLEINDYNNDGLNKTSFLLILLSPLWINAFDYILLGRMVYFYMPDKKIMGIRAERIAIFFVVSDIT